MMGVLPLEYRAGQNADSLCLGGIETFDVIVDDDLRPRQEIAIRANGGGRSIEFTATARVDTPIEVEYLRNGGILHYVLRQMAGANASNA
jgi:aconitate hydratase